MYLSLILQEEKAIRQFLSRKMVALCSITKQMERQLVVKAAIPCSALGGLNIGAGVYEGCYHDCNAWELNPDLCRGVKCFELGVKPDESGSCASILKQC